MLVAFSAVHHTDPITTFQAVVLGLLQGITELFPISSLGHTVLFPTLFGWNTLVKSQSKPESFWLAFVVMLHVGSALGLLVYFWRTWVEIVKAFFRTLGKRRADTPTERLAWLIVIATAITGVIGLAAEHPARVALAKPTVAAVFLVVNGLILLGAERLRRTSEVRELARREGMKEDGGRRLDTLEYKEAGIVGLAQAGGLIPGISRDGMCMATGLARGLDNSDAARFGFLLATPVILAAGLYKIPDLTGHLGDYGVRGEAVVACITAAIGSIISVHFLTRYFQRGNLNPFGIYCLIFGAAMVIYTTT